MRTAVLILLAVLAGCSTPALEDVPESELQSRLDALVPAEAPSLAVATAWRDRPGVCLAAGQSHVLPPRNTRAGTPYAWFSTTKLFTATAVMQLVESGRVNLDSEARVYVPEFRLVGPSGRGPTVRHLLSHTAGLPNPIPIRWIHLARDPGPSLDSMVARLMDEFPKLETEPGERAKYSNVGYLVLGQIIERVTGSGYPDYVSAHVLAPLGAKHSGYAWPVEGATGYQRRWSAMGVLARWMIDDRYFGETHSGYTELRPFLVDGAPYGGLTGNVCDLVRLGQAMLRDGAGETGIVLQTETVRLMLTPQKDSNGRALSFGLGWRMGSAKWRGEDEAYAYHEGGGGGFRSELRVYPRRGYAIAVVANETSFNTGAVARWVVGAGPHR